MDVGCAMSYTVGVPAAQRAECTVVELAFHGHVDDSEEVDVLRVHWGEMREGSHGAPSWSSQRSGTKLSVIRLTRGLGSSPWPS